MPDSLLTLQDVSRILKKSRSSIYRYCKWGWLDYLIIGSEYRFEPKSIDDFKDKNKRNAFIGDNILKNALTNMPPVIIDKVKARFEYTFTFQLKYFCPADFQTFNQVFSC